MQTKSLSETLKKKEEEQKAETHAQENHTEAEHYGPVPIK